MSYQELLSQAVVKGLGVTLGVVLGLVTVTPALKYLFSEKQSSRKQLTNTKQTQNASKSSQTFTDAENNTKEYKTIFDDLSMELTYSSYN